MGTVYHFFSVEKLDEKCYHFKRRCYCSHKKKDMLEISVEDIKSNVRGISETW